MKILTIAIDDKGEVKFTGDLEFAQAKQIIEAILLQQAFQQGIIKGKEEIKDKEVKNVPSKDQEG